MSLHRPLVLETLQPALSVCRLKRHAQTSSLQQLKSSVAHMSKDCTKNDLQ